MMKFWPPGATGRRFPSEMLASAGFIDVRETDVTKEYELTAGGWFEGRRRYYGGLKQVLGEEALEEKIEEGESILSSIKDGLVRRSLLTARRPV